MEKQMVGIPDEGTDTVALDTNDAINLLLNRDNTPSQASENIQESEDTQETVSVEEADNEEVTEVSQNYSESSEESAEDYQDSEESEEETTDVYVATVDGEQVEVTADDLLKSYQLEATAQKRLHEAAEEKKRILAEAQQVEAERKHYAENLNLVMQQMQQNQSTMTNEQWQQLYDEDPVAYVKAKEDIRAQQDRFQALQQEQMVLAERQLQTEQAKLLERIPQWKDAEVATKERNNIVTYAKRFGFTEQEIAATADSRVVDLLRRAYLYDALQQRKPTATKKVKKAPKMLQAGQPKAKVNVSEQNRKTAFDKLAKSGRKEDAISYLLTK
tara:strand:+ start:1869 stop:2858 length:990 start_codon:yes stop_codon:yes gene_type:complete